MILRLPPGEWARAPHTAVELLAEHDTMVQRDRDGIWHLELVRGVLLAPAGSFGRSSLLAVPGHPAPEAVVTRLRFPVSWWAR